MSKMCTSMDPQTLPASFFILFSTRRTSLQFTIGHRHLNFRVRHVDILRKRLFPSNLHCVSKDDKHEMDNTQETEKGRKEVKKIHKTVKVKQTVSVLRKKSICRRLLSNRKHYGIQNITNN